jgi:protein-tyrosine phosphatase
MTELYWLDGPWPGKLAISSRPRGGDWLADEIASWRRKGIDAILSLLTPEEEKELDLVAEAKDAHEQGLRFVSLPIADRSVPASEPALEATLESIESKLTAGKAVLVHCRQGIGRSSLIAALLLIRQGLDVDTALQKISQVRGVPVPETDEQRRWIEHRVPSVGPARK